MSDENSETFEKVSLETNITNEPSVETYKYEYKDDPFKPKLLSKKIERDTFKPEPGQRPLDYIYLPIK